MRKRLDVLTGLLVILATQAILVAYTIIRYGLCWLRDK